MKKLFSDYKKGKVKLKIEDLDDLWYLSQVIDAGDKVRAKTYRKVKLSETKEKAKVEKKPITLQLEVEKTELTADSLRVNGKTDMTYEDVPKGSYHTISLLEGLDFTLEKDKFLKFQVDKIEEACGKKGSPILIVVMDREKAIFALTTKYGHKILNNIEGDVQKKEERNVAKGSFYEEIIKIMKEYFERYGVGSIILASPAFWKDELMKILKDQNLKKKIVLCQCHSAEENAIKEVLRREEVQTILKEERASKEGVLVEELLSMISKDEKSAYGFDEVRKKAEVGAIRILLVSDSLIHKLREDEDFTKLEKLMKMVDEMKGEIHLINGKNEAGKKLDGLGGVGAILRY